MKGIKGTIAVLYRALMHQGIPIVQANEMELWETAIVLGIEEDKRPRLVSKGERRPDRVEDLPLADQRRVREAQERIKRKRESRGSDSQPI